ncbi:uncharacterized protein H6S33_004867 [Morchella sextelata]|uniref:uncharacterized protein n=1 Tax=Morchella sextelata TaxID=1174677 RepID=UPI001D054F46|nr:uncharacterized protein H6S33_004867 [Morchella sextelata]KAH0605645.1 hypothetical protein H6S33_004867 [Morchella sextelata]
MTTTPTPPGLVPPPVPNRVLDDPDDWEYFGEGANNALYRYVGADTFFKPYLLRLRKLLPGSPTTQKLHNHLHGRFGPLMGEYLMRTEIIALSSFLIPALNLLLTAIDEDEQPTDWAGRPVNPPKKKRRLLDEKEPWGLLVEDMSCGNYLYLYPPAPPRRQAEIDDDEDEDMDMEGEDEGEIWKDMAMIEFKPKWLTQSPNAPANWKLCRTCAVRFMQSHKNKERQGQIEEEHESEAAEFCPLDLSSGDPARIEKATFAIVNMDNAVMIADPTPPSDDDEAEDSSPLPPNINEQLAGALSNSLVTLLTNFFRTSPVIPLLTQLQSRFGSRGVFTSATLQLMGDNETLPSEEDLKRAGMATGEIYENIVADEDDIWTAMTLRDCSLFLKVWVRKRRGRGMEAKIDCKIGDLDLKGGEGGRAVYWRDVERRLRMGGWYTGKGIPRNCRTGED